MIKTLLFGLVAFALAYLITGTVVYGQTPTPTATPTPTITPTVTPSPTPTVSPIPRGAPSTGYGS